MVLRMTFHRVEAYSFSYAPFSIGHYKVLGVKIRNLHLFINAYPTFFLTKREGGEVFPSSVLIDYQAEYRIEKF